MTVCMHAVQRMSERHMYTYSPHFFLSFFLSFFVFTERGTHHDDKCVGFFLVIDGGEVYETTRKTVPLESTRSRNTTRRATGTRTTRPLCSRCRRHRRPPTGTALMLHVARAQGHGLPRRAALKDTDHVERAHGHPRFAPWIPPPGAPDLLNF